MSKSERKKGASVRFSRRGFLKGAAVGAAAAGSGNLLKGEKAEATSDGFYPTTSTPSTFDFTQQSGALQPDAIVDSACQFCNSLCRLKVHVKNGRIIDVLGEPDDPV